MVSFRVKNVGSLFANPHNLQHAQEETEHHFSPTLRGGVWCQDCRKTGVTDDGVTYTSVSTVRRRGGDVCLALEQGRGAGQEGGVE